MKYGIYFAYWEKEWDADYYKYVDKVAALGFDILEIACAGIQNKFTTDEKLYAFRDYAKDKGITLTAGYGPVKEHNLSSSDNSIVQNAKDYYKQMFVKLHKLDIHLLGGGLYSYWPVDYSQPVDKEGDLARSIKNMKEVAKMAEDNDVMLGMEALNRFEGYLINTCDEDLAYVEAVGSPNVGVMLDTFHMNIEEDNMGDAIRKAGKKLCHFHLGEQNRRVPGKGSMPWNEIGAALRHIGYDGTVVMEPFVLRGGGVGSDIKVWRDLIPNATEEQLDKDAADSLRFVKHIFEK